MKDSKPQVDKDHYAFASYYSPARWMSIHYQISEILKIPDLTSVLEIGPGINIVKPILESEIPGVRYQTVDIADDLDPDFIGPVTDLPVADGSFDVVCAFQVLEHLPFQQFELALSEIARVTKGYAIISLPHPGTTVKFECKVPGLPRVRAAHKIRRAKEHVFNGEHYWEIGKKDYPLARIKASLQNYFMITREYIPYENQDHHFFILKKI